MLRDLREYIGALQDLGDVCTVEWEVDPNLELGAIIRRSYEIGAPAPLFTNIKGTASGYRIFGAPCGLSSVPGLPLVRIALSLGLEATASAREIITAIADTHDRPAIPPKLVGRAPCKQNILLGDDASLDPFPTPLLHPGAGGPYVNTWGTIVVRTPDGEFTNWSIARIMMIDGKHMTGLVIHPQHIAYVWQQWADRGKPCPFALVQGAQPAVPFISSTPIPAGVEESGFIGALLGEPLEVVRCETIDLQVPASAEIGIEGHMSAERTGVEGPMGEFAGYVPNETSLQPVYTIDAITHRDDPIWPTTVEGEPVDEFHTVAGTAAADEHFKELRAAGLPVTMAWMPNKFATHAMVISVASDWREQLLGVDSLELSRRIWEVIRAGRNTPARYFILDDDVDPTDLGELGWALATRVHPTKRHLVSEEPILSLLPCYTPGRAPPEGRRYSDRAQGHL
jgi:4-hydroxy-3-polyprenylbenzoate decarboxylase